MTRQKRISVITPTLGRPEEVRELLLNLEDQSFPPWELVLVDGARSSDQRTRSVVAQIAPRLSIRCHYVRHGGGTAVQRNVGLDQATGDLVALIDDDIRLEVDFFAEMVAVFDGDHENRVGGVAGYISNQFLNPEASPRWRWYRRLRLFTTYEPGRYDFETGYPINRYLQAPHTELKELDFMGAGCAVWRREVFDSGLRFSDFFVGYGVLEDAHLSLRAARSWQLLENGRAQCVHLRSSGSRVNDRKIAFMSAVNYRFVFKDLVPDRTQKQELRFWTVQMVDLLRFVVAFLRRPGRSTYALIAGKVEGIIAALRLSL